MVLSRLESGQKKRLELETAARLAHALSMMLDQLCGLEPAAGAAPAAPSAPAPPAAAPSLALQRSTAEDNHLAAQIYGWYHDDGMTWRAIVQRLNTTGVPTRSGRGRWHQGSLKEFLLYQMPTTKKDRKAFLARYRPGRPPADEAPAPQPPVQRPRTRQAAPVG